MGTLDRLELGAARFARGAVERDVEDEVRLPDQLVAMVDAEMIVSDRGEEVGMSARQSVPPIVPARLDFPLPMTLEIQIA